jgi:acyl-CoA synthetase (AMP-forming)/AMP-acid ligase II
VDLVHTLTLGDLAREQRRSRPGLTAVVDGTTRLTYEQLDANTSQIAAGLAAAGVGTGDRVLWLGQTSFQVLELLIGCAKAGAILCPANWRQSTEELRFVLDDLQPKVVVWEQVLESATELRAGESGVRWLQADGPEYGEWLTAQPAIDDERDADPDSAVLALYTAAFSGRPNAALLSHRALTSHSVALGWIRQIEPGFTYLNSGPLFHVGTMMFCLATFQLGGTNVFMPAFDPLEACRLIESERCTSAFLYGPMADQLAEANAGQKFDLSSLRVSPGSAAWNAMVSLDESPWGQALGGYGQSEVAGMLTFTGLGLGGLGSHGRPMPFAQVRIAGPDGREIPADEAGEIVARGPAIFSGYWNRPELNAAKFRDGWHHTGDLGRRERDGTITFIGPKLRMIKSGGENIYPAEVEQALTRHAAVKQAAVIGVPDPKWGQAVKAIVVLSEPGAASGDQLVQHVRKLIAPYKRPREVVFTDSLPRKGFLPDYDALDAAYGGGGYPVV